MHPIQQQTTAPHCSQAPSTSTSSKMAAVFLVAPARAQPRVHALLCSQRDVRAGHSSAGVNYAASFALPKPKSLQGSTKLRVTSPLPDLLPLAPSTLLPGNPSSLLLSEPAPTSGVPKGVPFTFVATVPSVLIYSFPFPTRFSNLGSTNILNQMVLCMQGHSVHCRSLRSVPGLCLPGASETYPSPKAVRCPQTPRNVPWGTKSASRETEAGETCLQCTQNVALTSSGLCSKASFPTTPFKTAVTNLLPRVVSLLTVTTLCTLYKSLSLVSQLECNPTPNFMSITEMILSEDLSNERMSGQTLGERQAGGSRG